MLPFDLSNECIDTFAAIFLDIYTILAGIWYNQDASNLMSSQTDIVEQYGTVNKNCGLFGKMFTSVVDSYIPDLKYAMGMSIIFGIFF